MLRDLNAIAMLSSVDALNIGAKQRLHQGESRLVTAGWEHHRTSFDGTRLTQLHTTYETWLSVSGEHEYKTTLRRSRVLWQIRSNFLPTTIGGPPLPKSASIPFLIHV